MDFVPSTRFAHERASAGPACCPSGLGAPIERQSAEELAVLLKAVADATRLQILALLRSSPDCEACVCDIADELEVSQPTVSHHLRILSEAGIVEAEKRGYWTWYSLRRTRLAELSAVLT
jgi:ArsR family transcriptional regulator